MLLLARLDLIENKDSVRLEQRELYVRTESLLKTMWTITVVSSIQENIMQFELQVRTCEAA